MKRSITRREALAALASSTAIPLLAACTRESAQAPTATETETDALRLLDDVANNLLRLSPESATSLGIDSGARASFRAQLSDRRNHATLLVYCDEFSWKLGPRRLHPCPPRICAGSATMKNTRGTQISARDKISSGTVKKLDPFLLGTGKFLGVLRSHPAEP